MPRPRLTARVVRGLEYLAEAAPLIEPAGLPAIERSSPLARPVQECADARALRREAREYLQKLIAWYAETHPGHKGFPYWTEP